jgi:hypothetical protein
MPAPPRRGALRRLEGLGVEDDLRWRVRAQEDVSAGQAREVDVGEGDPVARVRLGVVVGAALRRPAGQGDELADELVLAAHRLLEGRVLERQGAQPPAPFRIPARLAGLDLENKDPALGVGDHEVCLAVLGWPAVAHRPGPGDVRVEAVVGREGVAQPLADSPLGVLAPRHARSVADGQVHVAISRCAVPPKLARAPATIWPWTTPHTLARSRLQPRCRPRATRCELPSPASDRRSRWSATGSCSSRSSPRRPLTSAPGAVLPYLLFEQAVADGAVEVHEIGTGTVPSVAATTKDQPVVIFAGDTITGGKQNRVINISVWLPAGKVTELPVTCLELGRWDPGVAARFGAGRKADYALRSMMSHQVGEQRRRSAEFAAAGAPVPHVLRRRPGRGLGGDRPPRDPGRPHSGTSALHELWEAEAQDARPLAGAFPCPAGATGLAVGVGGRLVALELFDHPATLAASWARLVESAVSAHLDHKRAVAAGAPRPPTTIPDPGALGRLVGRAVAALDGALYGPSVGEGVDLRLAGPKVAGSALVRDGQVVHVELFRVEA